MNTLKNHLILFDAECPMCKIYTQGFVSIGILDQQGRISYQELPEQACPMLDRQRAANEIAMVNRETGEVTYGVQSLFKIFGAAIPWLRSLFEFAPFVWVMNKIYAFVSYNRRVIIPPSIKEVGLQPTFRLSYRIAYLIFTWAITAYILSAYATSMNGLLPEDHLYREYLICGGQILFQGIVIGFVNKDKRWAYLGNMMTISFAGALLLLPGILVAKYFDLHVFYFVVWFIGVAGVMFLEHIRRSRLLNLGWIMTICWVTYRILVLLLIILNK
ncbi:DCC1-like thiol-disulfide oxidoreductase family protein [Pedobacter sp. PWIIR3]